MDYHSHIVRDPMICGGEPAIKGTRVTLRTVLASLAEGASVDEILADFPTLTAEDVRAVVVFAAASTVLDQTAGLWKDRDDLPDFAAIRQQWDRRP